MTMTEDGKWTWEPFRDRHNALVDKYNALVRDWNRWLPGRDWSRWLPGGQPVRRPLQASKVQCATVRDLRDGGMSLRKIAEETNLGLTTVRTIIAKANGNDHESKKRRARVIEIDRLEQASSRR